MMKKPNNQCHHLHTYHQKPCSKIDSTLSPHNPIFLSKSKSEQIHQLTTTVAYETKTPTIDSIGTNTWNQFRKIADNAPTSSDLRYFRTEYDHILSECQFPCFPVYILDRYCLCELISWVICNEIWGLLAALSRKVQTADRQHGFWEV